MFSNNTVFLALNVIYRTKKLTLCCSEVKEHSHTTVDCLKACKGQYEIKKDGEGVLNSHLLFYSIGLFSLSNMVPSLLKQAVTFALRSEPQAGMRSYYRCQLNLVFRINKHRLKWHHSRQYITNNVYPLIKTKEYNSCGLPLISKRQSILEMFSTEKIFCTRR